MVLHKPCSLSVLSEQLVEAVLFVTTAVVM